MSLYITDYATSQTLTPSLVVSPSYCYKQATVVPDAQCNIPQSAVSLNTNDPLSPILTVGPITNSLAPSNPNNVAG